MLSHLVREARTTHLILHYILMATTTSDLLCLFLWDGGSAGMDGLASQQEDSQIQILTVGHLTTEEGEGEPVMSCTQSQSKQDLRVTMLKKGTVSASVTAISKN